MANALTRLAIDASAREQARKAADVLERTGLLQHGELSVVQENGEKLIADISPPLLLAIQSTLLTLAESGEAFVLGSEQEVSPEKAAEILGISRPLVYQRMDTGKLPYRQIGTHRRILIRDVVTLRASEDRRQAFAAALSADTEELEQTDAGPVQSAS